MPKPRKNATNGTNVTNESHSSPASHSSHSEGFIPPHGGYENLLSYPKTQIIYICLSHQANYLLDQQLRRLEQDFLKEGGLRERMTRVRLAARANQSRARVQGR
jgi:four helix bundle suffix protein